MHKLQGEIWFYCTSILNLNIFIQNIRSTMHMYIHLHPWDMWHESLLSCCNVLIWTFMSPITKINKTSLSFEVNTVSFLNWQTVDLYPTTIKVDLWWPMYNPTTKVGMTFSNYFQPYVMLMLVTINDKNRNFPSWSNMSPLLFFFICVGFLAHI